MYFPTPLLLFRIMVGFMQGELAKLTGLTQPEISSLEALRTPSRRQVKLLCEFFNVGEDDLFPAGLYPCLKRQIKEQSTLPETATEERA